MNIFVSDTDEISINFALAENKNHQIVIGETEEEVKKLLNDDSIVINKCYAKFKYPSYSNMMDISKNIDLDQNNLGFSLMLIRKRKMITLFKETNLKDGDKEIKFDDETLGKMHPSIVNYIGEKLDDLS